MLDGRAKVIRWTSVTQTFRKVCHRTLNFSRNLTHNVGRHDRHLSGRGELALHRADHVVDRDHNAGTVFEVKTTDRWKHRTFNQRINGGRWVCLGTYGLAANDSYRVRISSQGRIVADAVKIMRP